MRYASLWVLCASIVAASAFAGPAVDEEGPLSPCVPSQANSDGAPTGQPAYAWGVEISSAFSKEEALAEFDRVKQDHSDLLRDYTPIVVATCDLHMGTKLFYSVRIGVGSRDDGDNLCAKLQSAGGACIVQKN